MSTTDEERWEAIDRVVAALPTRLRDLRRPQVMRTRLAESTGIDVSTLKRLEQRQVPTLTQLLRLCHALRITPWELLGAFHYDEPRERTLSLSTRSGSWALLEPDFGAANPIEQELQPRKRDRATQHDGTEWIYVVAGSIAVELGQATEPVTLHERGVVEFDASITHTVENLGDTPAVLLRRMTDGGARAHMPDAFSA